MIRIVLVMLVGCSLVGSCLRPTVAFCAISPSLIRLETRVSADSVTVGERFRIIHEVAYPDSLVFISPETFDVGSCRLLDFEWKEDTSDHRTTKNAVLEVITTDLDKAYVPKAAFVFRSPAGDTLTVYTDDVELPVRRLTGEASEPKPLKPQWKAPPSHLYLYLAGALMLLAAVATYVFLRWRRREVPAAPKPELPADFVALQALNEIEQMGLLEDEEFKKFYTLVIDTLRRYIERRYGVMAMDRTTDEILWDLRRIRIEIKGLEELLREADLVKFAKHRPRVEEAKKLMDSARRIIALTAPRPLAASE
ncbi:MAG: hypothetical protein JSW58_05245 [Candidatus Latescibacterota bacterium]|nr:MAG: hypothetical protein JSW58_05245 [Candidatus Latescibacterota bacterium]